MDLCCTIADHFCVERIQRRCAKHEKGCGTVLTLAQTRLPEPESKYLEVGSKCVRAARNVRYLAKKYEGSMHSHYLSDDLPSCEQPSCQDFSSQSYDRDPRRIVHVFLQNCCPIAIH